MARKKQLDKLSLDMIQCKKDGYGVHYGKWKAAQKPVEIEPDETPDGWRVCAHCGKPFKPKTKRIQLYCEAYCQMEAQRERYRLKHAQYMREYREREARDENEDKD